MKKFAAVFFAFVLLFSHLNTLAAQSVQGSNLELTETSPHCGICETAESPSFAKSAPGKIGRGAVNILFGWTNLFIQPIHKTGGNILTGIGSGFSSTLIRTIQGVVELGLFWLPPAHGEPLSHCAFGDLGWTGR